MDMVLDANIAMIRRAIRAGVDIVTLGDDYTHNLAPMMSPAHFREFIYPRLKKAVDAIHEEGALCIKHSYGNLWSILDMIVDTGVEAINPLEPVAGMDIERVKAAYGGGFILSSSNSIHSSVKPENYLAMVRTGQRYGSYPLNLKDGDY
jgi:uroporphyrinogen decarboxylase